MENKVIISFYFQCESVSILKYTCSPLKTLGIYELACMSLFVNTSREAQKICSRQAWGKPRIYLECIFALTHSLAQLLFLAGFPCLHHLRKALHLWSWNWVFWAFYDTSQIYQVPRARCFPHPHLTNLSHLRVRQLLMCLTHEEIFFFCL